MLVLDLFADRDQPVSGFLVCFVQQFDQVECHVAIFVVEERGGQTKVTHTSGTTDTMDVLLNVVRQVEIDDVLYVRNILEKEESALAAHLREIHQTRKFSVTYKSTSGHSGGHQDRRATSSEVVQCLLTFSLRSVTVNTADRVALALQEVLQCVGSLFGLHKYQRQCVNWLREREASG